jgi:hypothetical protein
MTPNKYRCETCENQSCEIAPIHAPFPVEDGIAESITIIYEHTAKLGCASHSSFSNAEQRIADAVEELRKLGNRESKRAYEVSDRCRQCYCDGVAKGCQTAISLLRDVKK